MNIDEIRTFLDCRYVGPCEAVWRILEGKLCDKSHTVVRLPIHLKDSQQIFFQEGDEEAALRRNATRKTALVNYFELNRTDNFAKTLKYAEIPLHYTLKADNTWNRRVRNSPNVIGRIVAVSPRDIERYHLRILLLNVPGSASFEDMRTFNDFTYPSFRSAAQARGLIRDDGEWKRSMEEGSTYMMPTQLRLLFTLILVHCQPADPLLLWITFKQFMIEDFVHQGMDIELAENMALRDIQNELNDNGYSNETFDLPIPILRAETNETSIVALDNNAAQIDLTIEAAITSLNSEQRETFEQIKTAVLIDNSHKLFFIDGPGNF
jgi:hypothetical protein